MKLRDIAARIGPIHGVSIKTAEAILRGSLEQVREVCEAGDIVNIRGFGTFRCREIPTKHWVNPKTKMHSILSSRLSLVFRDLKR